MNTLEFVAHFDRAHRTGPGKWHARCPAHKDRHPSLSITQGADGRTLLFYHAGCETQEILRQIGLSLEETCYGRALLQTRNGS